MTPFDVGVLFEGQFRREMFAAGLVAGLMNLMGKQLRRPISGAQLLGLKPVHTGPSLAEMLPEQREDYIKNLVARHTARRKKKGGQQTTSAKGQVPRQSRARKRS
jgi:hypothetical protein